MNLSRAIWTTPGVVLIMTSTALAQQAGSLRGVVLDREFAAPVTGATVTIVENGLKVTTNDQGNYVFNDLRPGRYTVTIVKDGFVRQVKQDVLVSEGRLTDLDVDLAGEFQDMDEVVVQELELGGSESALLELRLESPALLDSIGADMMAKAGAGDAASALLLVSGATVQDGKYAVVRGLPDRYVSAQLDGVRLPTSDAKRRAVQLDQFPSAIIQSVQVSKTFTPDQQGDASGGAVNIDLKDIPDETSFQIRGQAGFNSQVKDAGDRFVTYDGSNLGQWGQYEGAGIPLDLIGQTWPNAVGAKRGEAAGDDYKWSMSGGGKWEIDDGVKIGGFASLFYERDSSYFNGGTDDSWWITPNEGVVPQYSQGTPSQLAFQSSLLDIEQGSQSVQWGGIAAGGIETENHRVGVTYLYTDLSQSTTTIATNTRGKDYFCGPGYDWSSVFLPKLPPYDPTDPGSIANTTLLFASPYQRLETLDYTETTTESVILKGEHKLAMDSAFGAFKAPVVDWTVSSSTATWDQPDKTQFASIWLPPSNDIDPSLPGLWLPYTPAENINLGWVQHIDQSIDETSEQLSLNLKLPFANASEREGYFKTGVFHDLVERSYRQDTYSNRASDPNTFYVGGWDDPWSAQFPTEDHPVYESTFDVDYDGEQRISALYLMGDLPVGDAWNLIAGVRLESTKLSTTVFGEEDAVWFPPGALVPVDFAGDPDAANVDFSEDRALPSLSTQWQVSEQVVFRTAFAQTVARQTFRELTPVLQQEYLGGPIFIGNPELVMSSLDNYDLRIDYTPHEGWLVSASGFYKSVANAIEYAQFEAPQGFVYTSAVNYPDGEMLGAEVELRVQARNIDERLDGLSFGVNGTYISSQVTLPGSEQAAFDAAGFPTESRDMTGAPQYLFNANTSYEWMPYGTLVSLFYTVTGDTLTTGAGIDSGNYVPSIYTLPFGTLNFTLQQKIGDNWKLFFQAKNLLNPEIQTVYRSDYLPNGDIVNTSYTAGIDYAVGLSFQMDF
jgi:TonB-dependent receptor